jgi:hypothetical protein
MKHRRVWHRCPACSRPTHGPTPGSLLVTLAAALITAAGCGPKDPRITVHGTVTLDGQPLAEGRVGFIPDDKALGASGASIEDGRFSIKVYKGPSRVEITAQKEGQRPAAPGALPEAGIVVWSIIPARYNEKSTLSYNVQSASDRPVFDLTSEK